jgi:hypothetical protein
MFEHECKSYKKYKKHLNSRRMCNDDDSAVYIFKTNSSIYILKWKCSR